MSHKIPTLAERLASHRDPTGVGPLTPDTKKISDTLREFLDLPVISLCRSEKNQRLVHSFFETVLQPQGHTNPDKVSIRTWIRCIEEFVKKSKPGYERMQTFDMATLAFFDELKYNDSILISTMRSIPYQSLMNHLPFPLTSIDTEFGNVRLEAPSDSNREVHCSPGKWRPVLQNALFTLRTDPEKTVQDVLNYQVFAIRNYIPVYDLGDYFASEQITRLVPRFGFWLPLYEYINYCS